MSLRIGIALLLAVLFAVFVGVNWSVFIAPTTLSILIATVQAPLGLVMLGVLGLVVLLFAVYMAWWQGRILLDTRRHTKEMQSQRELADKAEASRFSELRLYLEGELRKIEAQAAAGTREIGARVDVLQRQLQDKLDESTRSLSAYVGEVDDKLDRMGKPG